MHSDIQANFGMIGECVCGRLTQPFKSLKQNLKIRAMTFTKVLVQTSATSRKYHFKHFFINEKKSKNASFFNYCA